MDSTLNKLPKSTFELTVTLPWSEIKSRYEKISSQMMGEVEVKGFRKGKAPQELAEKQLDKDKVFQEVIKEIVPDAYLELIKKYDLHPIVNPKIELTSLKEGQDWIFKALACEKPEVNLGSYKEEIKKLNAKSKIIVPGREPQPPKLEELIKVLLDNTTLEISDLLIENEANRLLAKLLDEIKALGLTLEQYLSSVGKTPESLRNEYTQKSINDIKLELILDKIAEAEKITVAPEEIEQAIEKTEDKKSQESLRQNSYLLASVLRQQKTLDFIKNL